MCLVLPCTCRLVCFAYHPAWYLRCVVYSTGYFDVRDFDDNWIRIKCEKGDMIVLPEGMYHRFTLNEKDYIKVSQGSAQPANPLLWNPTLISSSILMSSDLLTHKQGLSWVACHCSISYIQLIYNRHQAACHCSFFDNQIANAWGCKVSLLCDVCVAGNEAVCGSTSLDTIKQAPGRTCI